MATTKQQQQQTQTQMQQQQQQTQMQQQQGPKSGRPTLQSSAALARSPSSSHFAMMEVKNKIMGSLTKLGDRDTQQIAMEDLEKTIQTLTPEFVTAAVNSLCDTDFLQKPAAREKAVRFLGTMAATHPTWVTPHLPKIVAHIMKRLKDSDSAVREACQSTFGVLSAQYLGGENVGSVMHVFFKPIFDAFGEQNKVLQNGSALCLAKVIENAKEPPIQSFQKLCPRICKYLAIPHFLAKSQLLLVIGSLSQVGALSQQHLEMVMPCINEALKSTDWNSRKAAVDTLIQMGTHSSQILADCKASVIASLEQARFDRLRPVRDSVAEAMQIWKSIPGGECETTAEEPEQPASDKSESTDTMKSIKKRDSDKSNPANGKSNSTSKASQDAPSEGPVSNNEGSNTVRKTVGVLMKKAPSLTERGLNPEFFQKLENKNPNDLPVEVAVPKSRPPSRQSSQGERTDDNVAAQADGPTNDRVVSRIKVARENENSDRAIYNGMDDMDNFRQDQWMDRRNIKHKGLNTRTMEPDDWSDHDPTPRETGSTRAFFSRNDGGNDPSVTNGKINLSMIQRQLLQLEHQQASMMEMIQGFMGNSRDNVINLENRVRSLERMVEDMARELTLSSTRRGVGHMMGYFSTNDFSGYKFGKAGDIRASVPDRYTSSDGNFLTTRRDMPWRSSEVASDIWENHPNNTRRGMLDGVNDTSRVLRQEHYNGEPMLSGRRGWDRGPAPARLGEGPSARSVWKASKGEETLAAIRVAGEDAGTSRASSRASIPELDADTSDYANVAQGKDTWNQAMTSLSSGDVDSAYSEILFAGDEMLLVKLMGITGPVLDQLSTGTVTEVLHAISQLLPQQSFFDLGIYWIQQVLEMVLDNIPDCVELPSDVKKELLVSLADSVNLELPEDWEGNSVEELIIQLANAWSIELPSNTGN